MAEFLGCLPELVHDLNVLFSNGISLVVCRLLSVSQVPRGRVEVACHDVPADSATREVVYRAQSASEMIRLLVCCRNRHTKPQAFGGRGHGGDDGQGLVHGPLRARDDGGIGIPGSFVDIIGPLKSVQTVSYI